MKLNGCHELGGRVRLFTAGFKQNAVSYPRHMIVDLVVVDGCDVHFSLSLTSNEPIAIAFRHVSHSGLSSFGILVASVIFTTGFDAFR